MLREINALKISELIIKIRNYEENNNVIVNIDKFYIVL